MTGQGKLAPVEIVSVEGVQVEPGLLSAFTVIVLIDNGPVSSCPPGLL